TTALVTANFFGVFNLPAQLGRTLAAADDEPNAAPVAIVSRAFWQTRLAADPHVLGRTMHVAEQPYTIVGVMPAGFNMPMGTDVWLGLGPQSGTPGWQGRASRPGAGMWPAWRVSATDPKGAMDAAVGLLGRRGVGPGR